MKKLRHSPSPRGPLVLSKQTLRRLGDHGSPVAGGTVTTLTDLTTIVLADTLIGCVSSLCGLWSKALPVCPTK